MQFSLILVSHFDRGNFPYQNWKLAYKIFKMAGNESVVVSTVGNSRSVCVQLHPLVIMNISDHYTRIRAQAGGGNPQGISIRLGII